MAGLLNFFEFHMNNISLDVIVLKYTSCIRFLNKFLYFNQSLVSVKVKYQVVLFSRAQICKNLYTNKSFHREPLQSANYSHTYRIVHMKIINHEVPFKYGVYPYLTLYLQSASFSRYFEIRKISSFTDNRRDCYQRVIKTQRKL